MTYYQYILVDYSSNFQPDEVVVQGDSGHVFSLTRMKYLGEYPPLYTPKCLEWPTIEKGRENHSPWIEIDV